MTPVAICRGLYFASPFAREGRSGARWPVGGFAGFGPGEEPPHTPQPAVRGLHHLVELAGKDNAASGSLDIQLHPQDHAAPPLLDIDDGELHLADDLGLTRQVGGHGLPTADHSPVGEVRGIVKLDILGEELRARAFDWRTSYGRNPAGVISLATRRKEAPPLTGPAPPRWLSAGGTPRVPSLSRA